MTDRPAPAGPFRLTWLHLKVAVLNELQYRVNFFIQLFNSAISLGTALIAIALVYSHTQTLGGWARNELLAVMGVQILLGGVIRSVIEPNMTTLMEDVQQGTLDYTLTRPADAQLLVSIRSARIWQALDILVGLGVVVYAVAARAPGVGLMNTAGFALALILGAVLLYCVWLMLTTLSFKFVRVDNLISLLQGIYQAGRWPVSIYPSWLRSSLTFIIPLAFAITVPAEAVMTRIHAGTLAGAAGFTVIVFVVTRLVWRRGIRNYTGASA